MYTEVIMPPQNFFLPAARSRKRPIPGQPPWKNTCENISIINA